MKKKIDWFYFSMGMWFLLLAGVFFGKRPDYYVLIFLALSIVGFFKSYYQEKMSILRWLRK